MLHGLSNAPSSVEVLRLPSSVFMTLTRKNSTLNAKSQTQLRRGSIWHLNCSMGLQLSSHSLKRRTYEKIFVLLA